MKGGDVVMSKSLTVKQRMDMMNAAKNIQIMDIYRELFDDTDEVPHVDDIVDIFIAKGLNVQYGETEAESSNYITDYMITSRNICYTFGQVVFDCQEILVKDLYLDDTLLLGE